MTEHKGTYRLLGATRRFTSARVDLVTALNNVDCQAEVQQLFQNDDVADILFTLLEEPNKKQRLESAKGIISLIKNKLYIAKKLFEKGCVTIFLRYIQYHHDYTFRALMMDALRELCILDEAFANKILESGGIETFVTFLNHHNEDLKVSAAWAIAYLAKTSRRLAEEVVHKGAVTMLVIQMCEGSIKGRLAAIATLCHIILQSAQLAEICAKEHCITYLLDNMGTFKDISVQALCSSNSDEEKLGCSRINEPGDSYNENKNNSNRCSENSNNVELVEEDSDKNSRISEGNLPNKNDNFVNHDIADTHLQVDALTKAAVLCMAVKQRHNITDTAVNDILTLINLLCANGHTVPKNKYELKKILGKYTITEIHHLCPNLFHYQCLYTLAAMAISNYNVAQMIAQSAAIVEALHCVKSKDCKVACTACCLLANVMYHHREMAERVAVHRGCIVAILCVIDKFKSSECRWAIMCIGYISALSDTKAMEVLLTKLPKGKTFAAVLDAYIMVEKQEDGINSIMWLLYSLAFYSHNHADYVCHTMIMKKCVEWHSSPTSTASVKINAMETLALLLSKCEYPPALNALLPRINVDLLKMSLGQYMKILPDDATSRKVFFTSGALQKLQLISCKPGSTLQRQITYINTCFPREVIEQLNLEFTQVMWIEVKDSDLLRDFSESFIYSRFIESIRLAEVLCKKGLVTEIPRLHFLDRSHFSFSDLDFDSESALGISRRMETYVEPSFMELDPPVFDSVQPSTSDIQLHANSLNLNVVKSEFASKLLQGPSLNRVTKNEPESAIRPSALATILELVSAAAPGIYTPEDEVEQYVERKLITLLKGSKF